MVDRTGVGRPVIDLLVENGLENVSPVIITGGDSVTWEYVNGPKEDEDELRLFGAALIGRAFVQVRGRAREKEMPMKKAVPTV